MRLRCATLHRNDAGGAKAPARGSRVVTLGARCPPRQTCCEVRGGSDLDFDVRSREVRFTSALRERTSSAWAPGPFGAIAGNRGEASVSKDGHNAWTRGHPSRRAQRRAPPATTAKPSRRDEVGDLFHSRARGVSAIPPASTIEPKRQRRCRASLFRGVV
jgi:hypothetical protein